MTVARRLWIALGLNLALLSVVVAYHVRTIQRAVTTAHELSEVSARLVLAQARQSERVSMIDETAAKFAVTRDRGYLVKFAQLRDEFTAELADAAALPLNAEERGALTALHAAWDDVQPAADTFVASDGPAAVQLGPVLDELRRYLDPLREQTDAVGAVSQATMGLRLAGAADESARATRISWLAALTALLLAIVTALVLRRSITAPLHELTTGTHAVARGQFGHRLQTRRGGEFAQVASAFNAMTERLGELDRMKQEFVTTVSHDLKSPLASLRETTSLLLDEVPGPLSESQRRVLLLQRESADRLGRMIAKLLDLSRLEARIPMAVQRVDVPSFLEQAVLHADVAGRERDVRVRLVASVDGDVRLAADEDRLRQLLDNLLENAIKFSPRGGEVEVHARAVERRFLLSVADRGPGIDPEHADRIFERFYQAPAGRAVAGRGAGLGLTICREVVQAHRGRITVTPRSGGGSIFTAEFPGVQHPAESRPSAPPVAAAPAGAVA